MCIGIPMQVVEVKEDYAICEGRYGRQMIETWLLGKVRAGQWLLTFMNSGREIIDEERAVLVNAALDGLQAISDGMEVDLDHYFSDLINREPMLPDFLRKG